ncbi:MAG: hypothetical protein KHX03_09595 [Clostridium sp.]|nr:hypothetical protein [Clostridium sp.]
MTNYYIKHNDEIISDCDLSCLKAAISSIADIPDNIEIKETEKEIIKWNNKYVFKEEILDELFNKAKESKVQEVKGAGSHRQGIFF